MAVVLCSRVARSTKTYVKCIPNPTVAKQADLTMFRTALLFAIFVVATQAFVVPANQAGEWINNVLLKR